MTSSWPLVDVVPWLVALLGLVLSRGAIDRLTHDRVCVRLVIGSYLAKVLLGAMFYYAARDNWFPALSHSFSRDGFWVFSDDSQAHHTLALALVRSWQGLAPFPHFDVGNLWFTLYVAAVYFLFGAHPLTAVFLNGWYGTILLGASMVIMRRWSMSTSAIRSGIALLAFWPSLLFWSTQMLKDPLTLSLMLLGLSWLVLLTQLWQSISTRWLWVAGSLLGVVFVLSLLRPYTGLALVATADLVCGVLAVWAWCRHQRGRSLQLITAPVLTTLAALLAQQLSTADFVVPANASPATLAHQEVRGAQTLSSLVEERAGVIATYLSPKGLSDRRLGFVSAGGDSVLDPHVTMEGPLQQWLYLPRGLGIALFAPFPHQWFVARGRTGLFGMLAVIEMVPLYCLLAGFCWQLRRVRVWLNMPTLAVAAFAVSILIPMSLTVANLGTLFRLRLQFLLPLLLLACLLDVVGLYVRSLRGIGRWMIRLNATH